MDDREFRPGDRLVCRDADMPNWLSPEGRAKLAERMKVGGIYTVREAYDWRKTEKGGWALILEEAPLDDPIMTWSSSRFEHLEEE